MQWGPIPTPQLPILRHFSSVFDYLGLVTSAKSVSWVGLTQFNRTFWAWDYSPLFFVQLEGFSRFTVIVFKRQMQRRRTWRRFLHISDTHLGMELRRTLKRHRDDVQGLRIRHPGPIRDSQVAIWHWRDLFRAAKESKTLLKCLRIGSCGVAISPHCVHLYQGICNKVST